MTAILHRHLPDDMTQARALPGVRPETGPWLRVDASLGRRGIALRLRATARSLRVSEPRT